MRRIAKTLLVTLGVVVVIEIATGEQTRLTELGAQLSQPMWLGDDAVALADNDKLYRLDLATGELGPLLAHDVPGDYDIYFAISPDGAEVYYTRYDREFDIWTVTLD